MAFGVLVALITLPLVSPAHKLSFIFMVVLGSILLDIDHPKSRIGSTIKPASWLLSIFFGHRAMIHSVFFVILLTITTSYFFERITAIALFLGCTSHIVLDCFTKNGLNLLHPFASLHVRGFVETGSMAEKVVQLFIVVFILGKLAVMFF